MLSRTDSRPSLAKSERSRDLAATRSVSFPPPVRSSLRPADLVRSLGKFATFSLGSDSRPGLLHNVHGACSRGGVAGDSVYEPLSNISRRQQVYRREPVDPGNPRPRVDAALRRDVSVARRFSRR